MSPTRPVGNTVKATTLFYFGIFYLLLGEMKRNEAEIVTIFMASNLIPGQAYSTLNLKYPFVFLTFFSNA